jgi:hypothetical protein
MPYSRGSMGIKRSRVLKGLSGLSLQHSFKCAVCDKSSILHEHLSYCYSGGEAFFYSFISSSILIIVRV